MHVRLLGVRGSLPVSDASFCRYGGATMCVLVQAGEENILLDAGSGIIGCGPLPGKLTMLLSHPHADHLVGLPFCPALAVSGREASIWAEMRAIGGPREQAATLMAPPLWPVGPESFPAAIDWRALTLGPAYAGDVRIDHASGHHPGGVTAFRLSAGGKSIVYATDCELDEQGSNMLLPLAQDCDLLLVDAQSTDDEYPARAGWGHSSITMALSFSAECRARRTVLVHHDPHRTDAELDSLAADLAKTRPDCIVGRQGEGLLV